MHSVCIRVSDDIYKQLHMKLAREGSTVQQHITNLIAADLANGEVSKHLAVKPLDDATVLTWLEVRLFGEKRRM